ncbi:Uncharacterised protein [Halioglobus japonicus]|nr:Uncharacterised protein [Halioglobus japonicus]
MIKPLIFAIAGVITLTANSATAAEQTSAPIQLAQADTSASASADAQRAEIEAAVKIVQEYMTLLSNTGMDGETVYDISLLPDTKSNVNDALVTVMQIAEEPEAKSMYKTGVLVLAFFQPGVGETAIGLDEIGPNDKPWRDVVDVEMTTRAATVE